VDAWYDAHVPSGEDWRAATANALVAAPIFVLLFSKTAAQSDDIAKELGAATFQKKLVIPVRLEDIHPEGAFLYELASRNWFDAFDDTEARLAVLADRLAALVKGGKESQDAAIKLGAPGANKLVGKAKKRRVSVYAIGGLILAGLAIAMPTVRAVLAPKAEVAPSSASDQRVAFFGFAAVGDDAAVVSAASMATEEGFRLLELLNVETLPRTETTGAQGGSELQRASDLGARFALSGEIRREGDKLKSAVRFMDVPGRATISQWVGERSADKPGQIAYLSGSIAAKFPRCVQSFAVSDTDGAPDAETLALMGAACAADINGSSTSFRELMQQRPNNWAVPAQLAESLV